MKIEDFEKQVQPAGKRSRLEPFRVQIATLKGKGYTNGQVLEFLKANGVSVSLEAVRKYVNRMDCTIQKVPSNPEVVPANVSQDAPKKEAEQDGGSFGGFVSAKQKRERMADRYAPQDDVSNALIKSPKGE